jgi:hypothetical protein
MAAGPGFRIGDSEREAAAASLREHYARGRLTLDEFQQRLDAVFAAKTNVDLGKVTSDLPYASPYTPPWPPQQPAGSPKPSASRASLGAGSGSGSGYRRPNAARSWAWSTVALIVLAVVIIGFSWPFAGIFKPILILLAVFTFVRKMLRRILGGGVRRGRWM